MPFGSSTTPNEPVLARTVPSSGRIAWNAGDANLRATLAMRSWTPLAEYARESVAEWRAWLEEHHATESEVVVGFHKKKTGRPSMTWSEAVDQALCFGWIDGVRHSHGPDAYSNRFTPRKPTSNWSNVNVAKVEALTAAGRMQPPGQAEVDAAKADGRWERALGQ